MILTTAVAIIAAAAVVLALQGVFRFADTNAAPPEPLVTARVESGQVVQRLQVTGTFVAAERDPIQVPGLLSGAKPVITAGAASGDVKSGALLMKVADRPIFILAGDVPMYRSLSYGMSGSDVAQLRAALSKAGYPSTDPGDQFGLSTGRAVYDFYTANGVAPTDGGGTPLPNRWQIANTVIPVGEIAFFGTFPAHLAGNCGSVGDTLTANSCFLESAAAAVVISVSPVDAGNITAELPAEVQLPDGTTATGQVTGEVPAPPKTDATDSDDSSAAPTTVSFAIALDESPAIASGQVTVSVVLASSAENVMTVPAAALRTSDQTAYWLEVLGKGDQISRVSVDVGLCAGGVCEVSGDVSQGDEVRISGEQR